MSKGAVLQLAAYGAQDMYITGNPQVTHFKSVIKRHTNFAIETIENYFDGKIAPGGKVYCKLQRSGDLLSQILLRVDLPALQKEQGENNVYTSWVNGIGFVLIDYVDIQIGEQIIDRQYGQWMFIWAELTEDSATRGGLASMIGGHNVFTSSTQNGPLQLFIPLYFWFCRNLGSSLPLISLQQQDVRISFRFRDFDSLWVSNDREKAKLQMCCNKDTEFKQATLLTDYIFLDSDERRYFAQNRHFYLIEQLQMETSSIDTTKEVNVIDLPFNHPVKELFWIIQGDNVRRQNQWFNFSTFTGSNPTSPLRKAVIRFEGTERFEERDERYFRLVVPWQRHTATPNSFIYVYSFATDPENLQPTGTANFSRIDHPTLHLNTGQISESQVVIYAINYNILRIISGISGVLFSN